jgi:hypothetical protein
MPVSRLMNEITHAEFLDWLYWFEWRNEMTKRQADGLPPLNGDDYDDAEEMTAEETVNYFRNLAAQQNAQRK